jgi:AcrR family transcriptional regulator
VFDWRLSPLQQATQSPNRKDRAEQRRRRRPEEAEGEILTAAEELLRELPSHAVTITEIIARTTRSRKSFYAYFRDRHDLVTRLVRLACLG